MMSLLRHLERTTGFHNSAFGYEAGMCYKAPKYKIKELQKTLSLVNVRHFKHVKCKMEK